MPQRSQLVADDRDLANARLRQCVLFSGLEAPQSERVLDHTRLARLAEGEILFEQEQPAHELFLLDSGRIKLARVSPDGHEKIIDLVSPGGTFAEAVMFSKERTYPVTASALGDSRVLCIDAAIYSDILHQSTDACFAILAQMSRRLHGHIREIDRLTLHNATFRVVAYLLDQLPSTHLGSAELKLGTPKHVIASRLSITPETLSRTFARLGREGYLSMHDDRILIDDVGRLRKLIVAGG